MELKFIVTLVVGFVVISGVLALILKAVLSSQSNMAIERLKRINQENLQREMELKRKLDEAENEYNRRLATASEEAAKVREKMEQEAQEMKDKIISSAKHERENILLDARQETEELKRESNASIKEQALGISGQVINKLFSTTAEGEKLMAEIHSYLVSEALNQIRSAKKNVVLSSLNDLDEIEILSPFALTAQQKQTVGELFSALSGKHIKVKENAPQKQYLAGILIKVGNLLIDATLANRLKQIMSSLMNT